MRVYTALYYIKYKTQYNFNRTLSFQVIQKISAIDKDDPPSGHQFYFSLTAEAANNHNFSLQDNKGKNINVVGCLRGALT